MGLTLVAVNRCGMNAIVFKLFHQLVGTVLGAAEYQRLIPVLRLDKVLEQFGLATLVDDVKILFDEFGRRIHRSDADLHGVVQQAAGEPLNLWREGRREHQVLTLLWQLAENLLDVIDEPHVQHAVRFIENQCVDLIKLDGVLLKQIQQTARCCHQNFDAATQFQHLRTDLHATENDGGAQVQILAISLDAFMHLGCQFAGRCQHQSACLIGASTRAFGKALQQWQGETGGLAGACLRRGHDVMPLQNQGNGLFLDWSWLGIFLFEYSFQQGWTQPQIVKTH